MLHAPRWKERALQDTLQARSFKQEMIYAALKAPLFHGDRCFR
jgi:hypothetical protein